MTNTTVTSEQEIVIFHFRLGVAITQWANIEHQLRNVLYSVYEDRWKNREALGIGLFSLEGFRAKLAFSNGVIKRKLAHSKPQHIPAWEELFLDAREYSQHRNSLAHWPMQRYWDASPGRRLCLVPWVIPKPSEGSKEPPADALYTCEIFKFSNMFLALSRRLENFRFRICDEPEPHQESDIQVQNPPPFATIARQTIEVLAPQPLSKKEKERLRDAENAAASLRIPDKGAHMDAALGALTLRATGTAEFPEKEPGK